MTRDRQHWLPRAYLRNFRAGENDTIYVLDLFEKPRWRHVGFNEICNTKGYHSRRVIDREIDRNVVESYAKIVCKLLPVKETVLLSAVLDETEVAELLLFIRTHLFRNPLFLYRSLQIVFRHWVILNPSQPLPEDMEKDMPFLADDIRLLREVNEKSGHITSRFQKEAFILARLQQWLEEDAGGFDRNRIFPPFEAHMLEAMRETEQVLETLTLVYSAQPMFTVDNPFVFSRFPADELTMTLPLSPHHLLLRASAELPDFDPMLAVAILPTISFSTKILASAPTDLSILRLKPLPHAIDPANKDAEPDLSQLIEVVYENLPVIERHFSTRATVPELPK